MNRRGPAVTAAIALMVLMVSSAWAVASLSPGDPSALSRVSVFSVNAAPSVVTTDATPLPPDAHGIPLPASLRLPITVSLVPSDPQGLSALLSSVENPSSAGYRGFLTYSEFLARYAPSETSADRVASVLQAAGGRSIGIFPDRSAVSATLTVAEIESLFGVRLVQYGTDGVSRLFTAIGSVTVPSPLAGIVASISGLSNDEKTGLISNLAASTLHPFSSSEPADEFVNYTGPPSSEWFLGSDFTQEFGATDLFPGGHSVADATYPTKVAIATMLAGGYNTSLNVNLPAYDPTVVKAYLNGTLGASWPLPNISGVPVTIDGVTPPPPASFGSVNDSTLDEYENSLDLEMAGSLAPGATVVNFYFAGSLVADATSDSALANDFAETIADALAYDYAPAHLGVISGSFGLPDINDTAWNFETEEAAAMGVTIAIASGDQGNAPNGLTDRNDGQWPTWPGTADSNSSGSIAVGGVSVTIGGVPTAVYDGNGSLNLTFDSNLTGLTGVTAWYDTTEGIEGTEGGDSTVFAEPYWQMHSAAQPAIVNATETQGASTIGRAEPDVALPANNTIATVWANSTEAVYFTVLEGTSVAAPVFAGLLADVIAVESNRSASGWAPLGFFDPEIYNISSYYAAYPSSSDPFSSVTSGSNYVFSASTGWDALTGWGIVNATLLLAAIGNSTIAEYHYDGSTPGLPPPPPAKAIPYDVIYLIFGAGIVAAIVLVYLAARPKRPVAAGPSVPFGAQGGGPPSYSMRTQGGTYPGATFLCPYCGAMRPAEPVRCPQCGAY